MTASHVALAYLVASVLFILALKGLSHPETARRGNLFGIVGMVIAVLTTLALTREHRADPRAASPSAARSARWSRGACR